jgi:hypothetical protein
MRVLAEIKNQGTQDCLIVVCDGLKGLPEAIATIWPQTIVHLLRNSFTYASKKDWAAIARDLKPVYTAPSESAALGAFAEFSVTWEKKYPATIRLWTSAWAECVPFLQFDQEIRTIICTTKRSSRSTPGSGVRSTPEGTSLRGGRTEVRLPRDHEPGPYRQGIATLVQPLGSRTQRLRITFDGRLSVRRK